MKPADIRPCTVADLEASPNCDELLGEYTAESAIAEMGSTVRRNTLAPYRALEASGAFHALGAFDGNRIVGFITFILAPLPHFQGRLVASTESFFVTAAYRKAGLGLALLRAAEERAEGVGATALLMSAPLGSRLAQILDASDRYRETSRVFVRAL